VPVLRDRVVRPNGPRTGSPCGASETLSEAFAPRGNFDPNRSFESLRNRGVDRERSETPPGRSGLRRACTALRRRVSVLELGRPRSAFVPIGLGHDVVGCTGDGRDLWARGHDGNFRALQRREGYAAARSPRSGRAHAKLEHIRIRRDRSGRAVFLSRGEWDAAAEGAIASRVREKMDWVGRGHAFVRCRRAPPFDRAR